MTNCANVCYAFSFPQWQDEDEEAGWEKWRLENVGTCFEMDGVWTEHQSCRLDHEGLQHKGLRLALQAASCQGEAIQKPIVFSWCESSQGQGQRTSIEMVEMNFKFGDLMKLLIKSHMESLLYWQIRSSWVIYMFLHWQNRKFSIRLTTLLHKLHFVNRMKIIDKLKYSILYWYIIID